MSMSNSTMALLSGRLIFFFSEFPAYTYELSLFL